MTKKFQIISDAEEFSKAQKTKYQVFDIELGFERATILIPADRADEFMHSASSAAPRSITGLSQLVKKFGGIVE